MKLVVDIGGTYMRLALSSDGISFRSDPQKIKTTVFQNFEEALINYLQREQVTPSDISSILVARSGRNEWIIPETGLSKPFAAIRFIMVNDFAANAMGLVDSSSADIVYLVGDKKLPDLNYPRAVIGSGTGLGLAYISKDKTIQSTHGGHMLPAVATDEQAALFRDLQQFKTTATAPIYEDALSGNGILNIYKILCAHHHVDCEYVDTNHLIETGRNNPLVQQTLNYYHEILGVFAHQVLAFGHSYGGLYLTGGITDRLVGQNLFNVDAFCRGLYQQNVPIVLKDVRSTPIFWVKDEFISLKGLLRTA